MNAFTLLDATLVHRARAARESRPYSPAAQPLSALKKPDSSHSKASLAGGWLNHSEGARPTRHPDVQPNNEDATMKTILRSKSLAVCAVALAALPLYVSAAQTLPPHTTLYASGLEDPRGLRFGPDGDLYVAEAGTGGSKSTGTACQQVVAPIGPYTGGDTGRISKIHDGKTITVASGLPSTVDAQGDLMGVSDIAFLNGALYASVPAGGCSHGHLNSPAGIVQVNPADGHWWYIADLGSYGKAHPAAYPDVGDFEPDGVVYSLIAAQSRLFAVEPNHGQIFQITPKGEIGTVIDVSASQGHVVPTSVASRLGTLYVGTLNQFPIEPTFSRILTISNGGSYDDSAPGFMTEGYKVVASKAGFTTVVAVDFGPDGLLYVLELSAAAGYPTPGDGTIVRVTESGEIEQVVTGLVVPTGMTFGPDGALYVSNLGAVPAGGAPVGSGQILRVDVKAIQ